MSCYGATGVRTPNIDRLASQGLRFTNAHCTSATSTPSRYSLLTGEYAWRKKGTGIATGDAAAIIKPGSYTIASAMKNAGYTTGVVGKWHLGLGPEGGPDWNGEIIAGPCSISVLTITSSYPPLATGYHAYLLKTGGLWDLIQMTR